LMESVRVQDSHPQKTVLNAVAVYTAIFVSRSMCGCLKKDLRVPTCAVAFLFSTWHPYCLVGLELW
jgi:hypothetical protein